MIDCKVCCKICEQTLCRYAGTQRGLEVDCRYYMPKQKPQTNADRIRAMSDEELVRWVGLDSCPKDAVCTLPVNCEKCWLDWLRQPSKDGENE